jgi:hypothetical protein
MTKLGADTINAIVPIIRLIATFAGVVMLLLFINAQFDRRSNIGEYIAAAEQFRKDAQKAVAFSDSLRLEIAVIESNANDAMERANTLNRRVSSLQAERGALRAQLTAMETPSTNSEFRYEDAYAVATLIITNQDEVIQEQASEISELRTVVDLKDQSIFLLTQSRDSLQYVISNPPPIPSNPNKFLGINLPSRRAAFAAGAITATVAVIAITK